MCACVWVYRGSIYPIKGQTGAKQRKQCWQHSQTSQYHISVYQATGGYLSTGHKKTQHIPLVLYQHHH